jgi:hypothetical protein
METDKKLYLYVGENNPQGAFIAGVPLRTLTAAEFMNYADQVQKAIEKCGFYVKAEGAAAEAGGRPAAEAAEEVEEAAPPRKKGSSKKA